MKTEPVALVAAIAVIVVSAASAFHVVLDTNVVETAILDGLILVQAVLARSKVAPTG
jgi:hypothetical protein